MAGEKKDQIVHSDYDDLSTRPESSVDEDYDYDDPLNYSTHFVDEHNPKGLRVPTQHEAATLRRILGRASYASYLICLVELAERASYFSVSGVLANFIQRPLPDGSKTGAPLSKFSSESAGALGLGVQTSSALTLLLTFLAYVVPLYGGFVADTKLGRLKAIWIGVITGAVAHILFIIAGLPSVLALGKAALAPTILAIITLAFGTGFIKPNLLPLLMDQYPDKRDVVKVLPTGEKVIVDRQKTLERMTLIFYWAINVGSFFQLATSYAARRVGFWLAFFVPMIMYLFLPIVLIFLHRRLVKDDPHGSVLTNAWRIICVSLRGNFIQRLRSNEFWEYAKPTNMLARGEQWYKAKSQTAISWDDQWVLDIKQTLNACKIFVYFIIFNINDGGIGNAQNAQAGAMRLDGVPNDLFNNFNPLAIIILIPILDYLVYPTLRKYKIDFKPVYRIFFGFCVCASSQIAGAVIQRNIYNTSPCGNMASTCDLPAPITAWQEVSLYVLQAAGECFAMTTAYELAYTRSPPHMKGLVLSLFLFMSAISAAVNEALLSALNDPHLVWCFGAMAIVGFVFAFLFLFQFRNLHIEMEEERIAREKLNRDVDLANLEAEKVARKEVSSDDEPKLAAVVSIRSAVGH